MLRKDQSKPLLRLYDLGCESYLSCNECTLPKRQYWSQRNWFWWNIDRLQAFESNQILDSESNEGSYATKESLSRGFQDQRATKWAQHNVEVLRKNIWRWTESASPWAVLVHQGNWKIQLWLLGQDLVCNPIWRSIQRTKYKVFDR